MNSQQQHVAAELCRISSQPAAIGAWECNLANEALSWTDGVYDLFGLQRSSDIYRKATLDLYEERSRREMEQQRSNAIRTVSRSVIRVSSSAGTKFSSRACRPKIPSTQRSPRPRETASASWETTASGD